MFDQLEEYQVAIGEIKPISNVTTDQINKWILNTEHGLLHGFLVGYFAFQRAENRDRDYLVKLTTSCLLHDFYRCHAGKKQHDQKLASNFVDLLPDVYTHTDPPEETDLIVGDRIELRRYPDWREWPYMDIRMYTSNEREMAHFYKHVRPQWKVEELSGLNIITAAKQLCQEVPKTQN